MPRSPYWYANITGPDGIRHRRCTKETDKEKAARVLGRWQQQSEQGQLESAASRRLKVTDILEAVVTNLDARGKRSGRRVTYAIRSIRSTTLARMRAAAVQGEALEQFVLQRRGAGAADATVKYELAIVRRAFKIAVRDRRLSQVPEFPQIELHNERQVLFDRETFERLRDALGESRQHPEVLRDLLTVGYNIGWRLNETLPLTWDRVDFDRGTIRLLAGTDAQGTVHTTKNNDGRVLRFDTMPELADALRRRRAYTEAMELATGKPIAFVFHRAGKPVADIRTAWDDALEAAGFHPIVDAKGRTIRAFRWHDLRRTAATNLRLAGVPEEVAMQVTGHRTREVFRRYRIVGTEDLAEAGRKRAAFEAELRGRLSADSRK